MDWLKPLYSEILDVLRDALPDYWPDLRYAVSGVLDGPIVPETYLPLATCKAVGGNPRDAIYISASLLTGITCLRIFDDTADQDRSDRLWNIVGSARAWNFGSALQVISLDILSRSPPEAEVIDKIKRLFLDTYLLIAYGQDRDIIGQTKSIDDYWTTIEYKNAYAFSAACSSGAIAGTNDVKLVEACGIYGHHLGLATQILNDMDSLWSPKGETDLTKGKVTLPLLYGLSVDHQDREELMTIVDSADIASRGDRIIEILDSIDTHSYMMWAALRERDQALEAISACPDKRGREVLENYITAMFDDVGEVLS